MSWIRGSMIILGVFFISLIIAEGLLRIFWNNPYKGTRSSKIVEMKMQAPNLNTQLNREWLDSKQPHVFFRTDNKSFIQPSNQHENPYKTIMFMGASTTECSYVKEELRFPNYVSTLFRNTGKKINTINTGYSGNTLHDTINLFLNEMHKYRPDYVVVMHAANDRGVLKKDPMYLTRMAKEASKADVARWFLQTASSQISLFSLIRQSLTNLSNKMKQPSKVDIPKYSQPSGNDFISFKQRLEIFVNVAKSFNIEPILMTQPISSIRTEITPQWIDISDQEVFNEIIRNVGNEQNILVIDLSRHMNLISDYQKNPKDYHYDGIHVTDKGSIEYATIFFKLFSNFLEKSVKEKI